MLVGSKLEGIIALVRALVISPVRAHWADWYYIHDMKVVVLLERRPRKFGHRLD